MARQLGQDMGFTPVELDTVDAGDFRDLRKILKILRHFSVRAAAMGDGFRQDMHATWNDRAPIRKADAPKSVGHLSAAAIRYGMEAPAALAHAILAFMELSEQLPDIIDRNLNGDPIALRAEVEPTVKMRDRHHKVTFERMFAAYRAIILRDPNHLRAELNEILPRTARTQACDRAPIFCDATQASRWRQDFIGGRISSAPERLGKDQPLTVPEGTEPGTPTGYGRDSMDKALAVIRRNLGDERSAFDPRLAPAILRRLEAPLPP